MDKDDILTGYIVRVPKDGGGWDSVDVAEFTDLQIDWVTVTMDADFLSKTLKGALLGMRNLVALIDELHEANLGLAEELGLTSDTERS